jgi:capsular polysaccharide biosynthesis protein
MDPSSPDGSPVNGNRYVPAPLDPADAGLGADDGMRDGPGILGSLWRHRGVALVMMLLAALAGYLVVWLLPAKYQAQATLVLRDPFTAGVLGDGSGQQGDLAVYMAKQGDVVNSREVLNRAAGLLGGTLSSDDIRSAVQAAPSSDLASLDVHATASDPAMAAKLANAVGDAYQQVSLKSVTDEAHRRTDRLEQIRRGLQVQLDAIRGPFAGNQPLVGATQDALASQIADLRQREQDIGERAAAFGSGVDLFERAEAPQRPTKPSPLIGGFVGAVVGLVAAAGWAWWRTARDPHVQGEEDPAAVLGVPLLGRIPDIGRTITAPAARAELDDRGGEAYHATLASLEHRLAALRGTSVVVTGVMPGAGATSTVLLLADAALRQQRRLFLIDADKRTELLTEFCQAVGRLDLVDAHQPLDQDAVLDGGDPRPPDSTAVPPHPAAFFRSNTFRQQLTSLAKRADLVLIDAPALLTASETIAVAGQADAVVLVVGPGTRKDQLQAVNERLAFTNTPLLGYVYRSKS